MGIYTWDTWERGATVLVTDLGHINSNVKFLPKT